MNLQSVEFSGSYKGSGHHTDTSVMHRSSSELSLIDIALQSYPAVLIKRLDVDRYMADILDSGGNDKSDGPYTRQPSIQHPSSGASLIEIARHCQPIVLIKRLLMDRYAHTYDLCFACPCGLYASTFDTM